MVYVIAVVMGYFIATNAMVQKRASSDIGARFSNPTLGLLSALGGFGGWFCILPAAYFVGCANGNGFFQGLLFCVASLGGALVAGFFQIPGINYLFSALTLFINIGLAVLVYFITKA